MSRAKLEIADIFRAQAPLPSRLIERGRPGPGLVAHVLVGKYCDHLPLERQSKIYAREGVDLHRSTLSDWVGRTTALLEPLAEHIGKLVRAGSALFADDMAKRSRFCTQRSSLRKPKVSKTRTMRKTLKKAGLPVFGSKFLSVSRYLTMRICLRHSGLS